MKNFERIDEYLANRMNPADRARFEQQLEADPALKAEVEMQSQIVAGIRSARALELKSMLKNVPIETGTFSLSSRSVFRIAAGVAGIGVLIAATFYYIQTGHSNPADTLSTSISKQLPRVKPAAEHAAKPGVKEMVPAQETPAINQSETKKEPAAVPATSVQKPAINVADPSAELAEESAPVQPAPDVPRRGTIAVADIRVSVDRANAKYNFHYQFEQGALRLFGPFDSGLFEVLEVQGESVNLFLFYQSDYFSLAEKQNRITKLEAVTNPELLRLLREYHKK